MLAATCARPSRRCQLAVSSIAWCVATILKNGYNPVPLPVPSNLHFDPDALGWLKGTEKYKLEVLQAAGVKTFGTLYTSKKQLVHDLVNERGLLNPDRLAPDLAKAIAA